LLLVGAGVGIFFALPGESQEETETSPTHALAIWDRYGQHASTLMVMQMNGNARNTWNKGMTQPVIEYYTGVSTKGSCSLVYQNKFYFFGGDDRYAAQQISVIEDCGLKRVGELSFEAYEPSCTTANNTVFICFYGGVDEAKKCFKDKTGSDSIPFSAVAEEVNDSSYTHSYAYISSSETHILAAGSAQIDGYETVDGTRIPIKVDAHLKTELLDLSTLEWETKADYPSTKSEAIVAAPTIYRDGRFYLFGGTDAITIEYDDQLSISNKITSYDPNTDKWANAGKMIKSRSRFGIVPFGEQNDIFMYSGGKRDHRGTELCNYMNHKFTCTNMTEDTIDIHQIRENVYDNGLDHLFAVPKGYCL